MALFLFILAKAALASLPTAHLVVLRPPFPVWHAQFVQSFLLKYATFYKLSAGLCTTNSFATFFPQTIALFSLRFPLLRSSVSPSLAYLAGIILSLLLFYYQTTFNEPPVTHFSRRMTRSMSWSGWLHCSSYPLSYVVSLLLSLVSTLLFSGWTRTVSTKFLDTNVPSVFTEKLVLSCHACCVLTHHHCSRHSLLLNSYL